MNVEIYFGYSATRFKFSENMIDNLRQMFLRGDYITYESRRYFMTEFAEMCDDDNSPHYTVRVVLK